jgi:hypothetical protein
MMLPSNWKALVLAFVAGFVFMLEVIEYVLWRITQFWHFLMTLLGH